MSKHPQFISYCDVIQEFRAMDSGHATADQDPGESRMEQETGNEEHATRNQSHMEPETGDEEHAIRNQSHMEPETGDEEHATRNQSCMEPEINGQVHATSIYKHRTNDELGTGDQQSEISDQEPGKREQECVTCDHESGLRDQEHLACYQKPDTNEHELGTRDPEHVTCDQDLNAGVQETRLQDQKYATSDQRSRILEEEPVMKNKKFDSWEHKHGIRKRNPGTTDMEHCTKEKENIKDRENPNRCLVCFEIYDTGRRPRMLPCGHSLCSSCINNMIISSCITCPSCRAQQDITTVDQVPINYDLEKLISPGADVTEAVPALHPNCLDGIPRKRFLHYFNLKNFTGIFLICGVVIFLLHQRNATIISTEDTRTTEITKVLKHVIQQQISRNSEQMASFEQTFTYLDKYDEQLETGEENFRKTVQELEVALKHCKQLLPQFQLERDWVRKAREEGIREKEVLMYNQEYLRKATTSQEVTQAAQDARHQTVSAQAWLQHCKEYVYDISMKKVLQFQKVMKFSLKLLNTDIVEFLNTNFADMLHSLQKQVLRELCQTELLYCEVTLHGDHHYYRHVTFQDNTIHLGSLENQLPPSRAFTLPLSELVKAVLTSKLAPVYVMVMESHYVQMLIQDNKIVYHSLQDQPDPNYAITLPLTELVITALSHKSTPVYAVVMKHSHQYSAQLLFQEERFILQAFQDHPVPDHTFTLPLIGLLEVMLTVNSTPVFVVVMNNSQQYSSQVLFQDNKFVIHPFKLQPLPNHAITLQLDDLVMAMLTEKFLPVYVVMMKDSRQYSGQVLLQDKRVVLQSLKDQPAPDQSLTLPYNRVQLLVDDASALTFLDLAWRGSVKGRVYIQLTGKSGRGQLFLTLCTGGQGPSYRKSLFFRTKNCGYNGEKIIGGDYEDNDGSGGKNLPGLISGNEQHTQAEAGFVHGIQTHPRWSAQFAIVTKPYASSIELIFGRVMNGMEVVIKAVNYMCNSYNDVTIEECGLVLPL